LAKEFDEFEVANYGSSKLAELVKGPAISVRNDHTTAFIDEKNFNYREAAKRGIQHGTKLYVIETLLETRGISALLAFTFNNSWKLRLDEIVSFVGWLRHPRFSKVLQLAQSKAAWFDHCACLYIGQTATPIVEQVCTERRQWEVPNIEPMNLLAEVATANLNRDPVPIAQRINLEPHSPEELTLPSTTGTSK